ncbi:DUF1631 domain-containing protein [Rhodanobacter sp. C03]|uniref:DUF1631 domain-containing protein n=1 Tax=Rhodanobacter sp. C03 TaxID=1945858 RepID=UPI000984F371|nr:DUF1631 domain-containing protein [Rhodanobacter sp. C03]OOG54543.1 hypothetical protein B0E48_14165 [Rhodanobacter sp. C03]
MNEASDPSRVVNLSQRMDPASERVGELLNAVRGIANRRLQQWIGNAFEHVDDALFDLAEKAENNAAQMHYFDGMREVRKRRPAVERNFLGAISRQLGELTHPPAQPPVAPSPMGTVELSLVADNDLEESLAITSMIGKNESRLSRDLFAVNQRLSVICGGHKIDDAGNPVAPAILSQAFRQALHELSADMRVKLIIYKLFDRYVLSSLEELYQEINTELVRAGVLPQLRHSIVRGGTAKAAATGSASAQPVGAQAETGEDTGEIPSDLLQTLHALFSARRGSPGGSGGSGGIQTMSSGPLPSANELLGALSVLQSQIASAGPLPLAQPDDAAELSREVMQLKGQLLSQIGALRGERPSHVATIDEDTIDLVGMLFEFILEDRNLPAEMQVMLARLQIPYLKAAILDRKLFAHRQHPARRLLDCLAEQAKSWSEESDRDRRLHDKVKSVVEHLLHDFDDDMGIFERLLVDLQQFQDVNKRRSELAEQRVAESTRGREKLEQARRRAAREILDRIGERKLPPLVHGVLARAWANHLVLTLLRQGESSPEFRSALHFVDDFIVSTRPAPDPESRQMLRQMLPGIERSLRLGLANVAFQEHDIERLLGQLHAYYRQQLGEPVAAAETITTDEDTAMLAIPDSIQPVIERDAEPDDTPIEDSLAVPPDSPEWQQVQVLQPGTWLEFSHLDEPMVRAKLSWISPMSGRYLFVNRRGLKVADYSPQELAILLIDGKARILAANALFDRALSAIVGRLSQPESPSPATDTE